MIVSNFPDEVPAIVGAVSANLAAREECEEAVQEENNRGEAGQSRDL